MLKKFSEIGSALGVTPGDAANWRSRVELRTVFAPTVAGSAQRYSFDNALELALIGAFVRVGVPLQVAVAMAYEHVQSAVAGRKVCEWAATAAGNYASGRIADDIRKIDWDALQGISPNDVPAFFVVRVGEIVRRVQALFEAEKLEA